jgi:putative FmdB family regulatory protein
MPTYDYECDACGHKQETFQNISDPILEKCPQCKKKKFRRLFGAGAGVIFKGSGFYTTDYRGDSYAKAAAADKPSESSTSTSSDSSASKTESKPAAKPDSSTSSSATSSSSKPSKKKD